MKSSRSGALNNKNEYSGWRQAESRLVPKCRPAIKAGFSVPAGGRIYTVGSCFARNIEEHLSLLGFDIPTFKYEGVSREWPARENGILNRYTPAAIWQDFQWYQKVQAGGGIVDFDNSGDLAIETTDGLIDLHLGGFVPVSRERFIARRQQIYQLIGTAFDADCVVITLGMIEAWFDIKTGLYVRGAPAGRHFQKIGDRFEFHVLSYSDSHDYISSTIDLLQRLGRGKILLTTSPVPMKRTFTNQDVIIANMFSKSLLRTVCGEIATEYSGVDYFPAFEAVQGTRDWSVFKDDRIHVSEAFVSRIVSVLAENYFSLDQYHVRLQRAFALAADMAWPAALDALCGIGEIRDDQSCIFVALVYGNNDRQQSAVELLTKVDAESLPPRHWPQYVDATLAAGMISKAVAFSEDRVNNPRASPLMKNYTALALRRAGRREDARAVLEDVTRMRPPMLPILVQLAELDAEDGDAVSCRKWIEQARKYFPGTDKFDAIETQIAT